MVREKIAALLATSDLVRPVKVCGWVRTRRGNKKISFVELNDGSTVRSLQVVIDHAGLDEELIKKVTTGAALQVVGELVPSQGQGQDREVQAKEVILLGEADPEHYPLQKKAHSLEFLRELAHLRPRTNTFSSILRIRHGLAWAVHAFFHERGFWHMHTPIITGSDTEGAGQLFQVTTLPLQALPQAGGKVDYSQDFFGRPAHLTVSGQLEGELTALALGDIYTFGPTFRAENSNTTRHLAEFWMIEPEMAFYDLHANAALAESLLKRVIGYALEVHEDDLLFLENTWEECAGLRQRLAGVIAHSFAWVTYTEAVEILGQVPAGRFSYPVSWGIDLQSEHERYLVEEHFKRPVTVVDYPKDIKAFYMRLNDDGKTVAAMDILFPVVGEMVGGSQREERLAVLMARIQEMGLNPDDYSWYLDTRRYGSAPHSGFGLGFERLVQFVTGMGNIRDAIPFPRYPGSVAY